MPRSTPCSARCDRGATSWPTSTAARCRCSSRSRPTSMPARSRRSPPRCRRHGIDGVIATNTTLARDGVAGICRTAARPAACRARRCSRPPNRVDRPAARGPRAGVPDHRRRRRHEPGADALAKSARGCRRRADLHRLHLQGPEPGDRRQRAPWRRTRPGARADDGRPRPPVRALWRLLALLALAAVAGCSSLPVVTPDMARVDPETRPVPARQRPHPLARNAARQMHRPPVRAADQTDVLARHLALEQAIAGAPLTLGNRVVLLRGRAGHLRRHVRGHRRGARPHQHGDLHPRGRRGRPAVRRRPDRASRPQGVQVNLIYDSVGTLRHAEGVLQAADATPASRCSSSTRSTRSPPRQAGTSTSATTASC